MAGANYMGGKKNAAKVRSRDAAGRQQKRFFGRQRLNLLSKRRSINSPTSRNQPQPSISLAHAKQNSTLPPQGYIPSPSKPRKSGRDGPSSASSSSKVLEALDTSESMFLRAAMNQILSLPDLAGLSAYKRIRVSEVPSPEARRSKRIKSELSPEKDEDLFFGSQNDRLCDSPDASSRDIYHDPDNDEYDEKPDDTFLHAHLGSHTTSSKSSQLSPVLAPSQRTPHIPTLNNVAQATSSFGTLAVTSSLQTSFSGNIFDYEDPWTAVGVILGLQSAPNTPAKDADNTSALAEEPRPPVLAHQRRRVRLTAHSSSDSSSEGIPVASSHSSDNFPPPPRVGEDDSYSRSDDFHFGEDDSDHDFDDHDIAAHVHQKLPPPRLESYISSAYFSSSNDHLNNLAREPVTHEEGKDLDALFDRNPLRDGSTSDSHSQPVIDEGEDYAEPEDPDGYTLFETSSWSILDVGQCIEEPVPADYSSGLRSSLVECPSSDSLHEQDPLTTAKTASVSLLHRSSPSVAPRFNTNEDDLHFAQQVSSNASACSSRHSRVNKSLRASHSSPANASLCPLDDAQDDGCLSTALPISTRIDTPNSDSLVRHSQVVKDPESAFEFTSASELTHETFSTDKIIHSAYSPVEVVAPQSFAGFCLFSRDDFLAESDSDG